MKLKVINSQGKETGKEVDLPKDVFGVTPNDHAIYLDVKQYLANQRQGTHKTKDKGEIRASTRKIKKQKGTGTARQGSAKSGIMVGGGRFHGPRPRSYHFKLNRKLKDVARRSALSYKAKDKKIQVLESVKIDQPSTRAYSNLMQDLDIADVRTLVVTGEADRNVYLSARNIQNTEVVSIDGLNTYSILKAGTVVFTEESIKKFVTNLKGK